MLNELTRDDWLSLLNLPGEHVPAVLILRGTLVAEVERRLASQGTRRITALVEKDHPWAMGFWRAAGYDGDQRIVRLVRNLGNQ